MTWIKQHVFLVFLFLYSLYGLLLIFRSSFVINGQRYFTLFDDEMISMRYARNLAHGFGLVWNPGGERVEGFTNPLWTLYMAFWHLLPIPQPLMGLPIQLTGLVCLLGTLWMIRKIVLLLNGGTIALWFALLLTASYFPLNNWSIVLGTEVSLLTLLLTSIIYLAIKEIQQQTHTFWIPVVLGISTAVRFDMIVPSLVVLGLLFYFTPPQRKKILLFDVFLVFGFLLIQELVRFSYYHDWFPNTYYLKMTGYPPLLRILRGFYVLPDLMDWVLLAIPLLVLVYSRNKYMLFLLVVFLGQVSYSVFVGGDAWEQFGGSNRYISIGMPGLFLLIAVSIAYLKDNFRYAKKRLSPRFSFAVLVGCLALLVSSFNTRTEHMPIEAALLRPPETIGGDLNQVKMAQAVNQVTDKKAVVGIVWAGIVPYYTDRTYIDLLGKSDRTIGHEPMHVPTDIPGWKQYVAFYPGHMKWDYPYVFSRKPDLFAQIYPDDAAKHVILPYYQPMSYHQEFLFYRNPHSLHIITQKI